MTDHETGSFDRDLAAVEELLLAITTDDRELVEPPPDLWDLIQAEVETTSHEHVEVPPAGPAPIVAGSPAAAVGSPAVAEAVEHLAEPIPLRPSRRLPGSRTLLGAAAAVVLVAAGLVIVNRRPGDESVLVASAELSYEPETFDPLGAEAAARVSLVEESGHLQVEIDESDLPALTGEAADLELWLIEPDDAGNPADLVSLGLIDAGSSGRFDVPAGYDPDAFFVVDISVEPRDGDETHSGRSILRGPLTPV